MIKKFTTSSFVYAGSALLFSIGRQIVFLPILHKIAPTLFQEISFLLVLVDFLVYSMGASISDYYVKKVTLNDKKLELYKFLFYFSFLSLFSVFIFLFYQFSLLASVLIAIYLLFYIFNTLQMKLFFNDMQFSKNYFYIMMRLIPYALLLIYCSLTEFPSLIYFIISLILSETIAFYTLRKQLDLTYNNISVSSNFIKKKELIYFIVTYLLISLVMRLDMLVIEYNFTSKFTEYYQMISIYMIFINPIILLSSGSLLSILTKVEYKDFLRYKYKILFIIITVSIISGLFFQFFGQYIINLLYPDNSLINSYTYLSFLVIFTTLSFQMLKTFIIKYNSVKKLFFYNTIIIIVSIIFIFNFIYFIVSFYLFRLFIYLFQYMKLEKE